MTTPEVRLERLRPDGIDAALDRAPIAWIPLGALEFHADHLPNGTDGLTGHGLLVAAAERIGGVVLPWSYLTMGTLALPWSFRFDPGAGRGGAAPDPSPVARVRRPARGGPHGPRPARPEPPDQAGVRRGLGRWLGAAGDGALLPGAECRPRAPGSGRTGRSRWTTVRRWRPRGSRRSNRTSWTSIGCRTIRRRRVSASMGRTRVSPSTRHGAPRRSTRPPALLAERAAAVFGANRSIRSRTCAHSSSATGRNGSVLAGRAGSPGDATSTAALLLTNPGPVSRYLSGMSLQLDGASIPSASIELVNPTVGETGLGVRASELGPEHGFYIRRQQTAEVRLPEQVRGRTARGPPRPLAGRGHRDGARRDGRVPVSVVGPGRMVRTVRGPVDPAALGITTMHEHLWMDSTPLLAVHGYDDDRHRPVGRRDRSRSPLEPGRPHGQLPPDRRRRGRSRSWPRSPEPVAARSSS